MDPARPNIFQRLLLQWETLHPYNAAQAMHLRGAASVDLIRSTWIDLVNNDLPTEFVTDDRCEMEIAQAGSLDSHLSHELNHKYEHDEFPFRPFVVSQDGSHYVGVTYRHCVADSASIRQLMWRWLNRLLGSPVQSSRLELATRGYFAHLGPRAAGWNPFVAAAQLVSSASRMKQVRRVESPHFDDGRVRFSSHRVDGDLITPLRASAKRLGVTVNDLFLAAIARTCNEISINSPRAGRTDLALGTIHDLRHNAKGLGDRFGLFLGFTTTFLRGVAGQSESNWLREIAAQSQRARQNRYAEASPLRMAAALAAGKLFNDDPTKLRTFYRKRMPLAGGVSNVNLATSPFSSLHPNPLIEYLRVSPTGPMMPLVFTPSTLGTTLNFGLTVRAALISDSTQHSMARSFVDVLHRLSDSIRP